MSEVSEVSEVIGGLDGQILTSTKVLEYVRSLAPAPADAGAALVGAVILFACKSDKPMAVLAAVSHALHEAMAIGFGL